jgi:hypothetical protein
LSIIIIYNKFMLVRCFLVEICRKFEDEKFSAEMEFCKIENTVPNWQS